MRIVVTAISLFALASVHCLRAEEDTSEEKKRGFLSRMTNIFSREKKDQPTEEKKPEDKKAPAPKPKSPEPTEKKSSDAPPKLKLKSTEKPAAPKAKPKAKDDDKPAPKPKAKEAEKPASKPKSDEPPAKPKTEEKAAETAKKPEPVSLDEKMAGKPETPAPKPTEEPKKETAATEPKKDDKSEAPDDKAKPGEMKHTAGEFDDISAAFGAGTKVETSKPITTDKPPPEIATDKLPPPPPLPNSDGSWEIVKLNGRDYVTADSIQRFYRFNALKVDGKHVWMRSSVYIVKADIGSQELLINNTKFILSDNVAESKGKALFSRLDLVKLIDPVLLPNHIQAAEMFDTVVIDAGHGGHDSGAKGIYGYEKDFTLKMALSLSDALQKRGFKTVLTRRTDEFISLPGRVAISNATPRSIFISLHFNSSGPSAAGVETWALSPQGASSTFMGSRGWDNSTFSGNRRDSENIALATAVHAMVIHNLSAIADKGMMNRSMVDRGIKRARWTVLTGCNRPGILFEGGFVTNANEGRLIASQTYREYLTNSIADAVLNYRKALYPNVAKPSIKR
jgi:N-acetylmuramoyl-L-alanine amidase